MAELTLQFFCDWIEKIHSFSAEQKNIFIDTILNVAKEDWEKDFAEHNPGITYEMFKVRIEEYRPVRGARSGKQHWNWKGGITPQNQTERHSKKYAEWRNAVFQRDKFTCQMCGRIGCGLNAHHIKRWSTNVDERYNIDNGVTLCKKCHAEVHRKRVI